ncbi:hypothetical protein [Nitrobacter sp.]|uniref:hypothetical protein n=1 Tax=Nitrobacter sp. TaxID=29420 RepID=UPI0029CAB6B2|nr:hypothetical protein [Nitrobacter sp.]
MRKLLSAVALAALFGLTACGAGQPLSRPEDQAATLTGGYAAAKAAFVVYAMLPDCGTAGAGAICKDPAVVDQVTKAEAVADVAVAKAAAAIIAAKDASAAQLALQSGLDAIAIFEQALKTYGVQATTGPKSG